MDKKIKIVSILALAIAATSCATSPKGENVLMNDVSKSRGEREITNKDVSINKGRPIFIKAYAYPQVLETGDIWGGGNVFIEMGREKFDLNKIISKN